MVVVGRLPYWDCNSELQALPPGCGGGHSQPDQTHTTLHYGHGHEHGQSSLSSLLGRTNLMELGFDLGGSGMEQAPLVKISVEPQSPTFSQAYKKKTYTVTFVAGSSPSGTSSFAVDRMIELPLR
ncbi:hypothetical protein EV1_023255 [Malus domestica]